MLHIGVDMHKRFSEVAVMDDAGRVIERRKLFHDEKTALREFFARFRGQAIVTLEATRNWYWLFELIEAQDLLVKLAHPRKVRLIAEATKKTDKVDARDLAHLERTNFLPEAYIPTREIRDMRELLRYRIALVHSRTGYKDRVHALLDKLGICHPFSDLFGLAGRRFLDQLELRPVYRDELKAYLRTIDFLAREAAKAGLKIKAALKADPRADLLISIPGVGILTAYLLLSEIGPIDRFQSAKKLCAYAGLVGKVSQSGDHCWAGPITKAGNRHIRWAMVEAAQKAPTKDQAIFTFYHKIAHKRGPQKARVAVARKLLMAVYHILIYQEAFDGRRLFAIVSGEPDGDTGQLSRPVGKLS